MKTIITRATNGTGFSAEHHASMVRAIRGELPPESGTRWFLDAAVSGGDLVTSHPVVGASRYALQAVDGTLAGIGADQFELALVLSCSRDSMRGEPIGVLFRSASLKRPDTFRYIAKGEIAIGRRNGIAVLRVHDLSWVLGTDPAQDRRILTVTATLERPLWNVEEADIRAPWLTRKHAEVFLHTEWIQEEQRDAA